MNGPVPIPPLPQLHETVIARLYSEFFVYESSTGIRILLIVLMAILAHVAVKAIRRVSEWLLVRIHGQKGPIGIAMQKPKFDTVTRLVVSGIAFLIYFLAIGLILQEFGELCCHLLRVIIKSLPPDGLAINLSG